MTEEDSALHYGRARYKRALVHFATGRVASGVLGVMSLLVLVRVLPEAQFGLYAAMLSMQVVFLAYSSFGLEPAMERYLPELRLTGTTQATVGFVARILGLRLAILCLSALLLRMIAPYLSDQLNVADFSAALDSYVWVILAVALMNTSGVALEALWEQKAAQISAVFYAAIRFSMILAAALNETLDIAYVIQLDLSAALAAFAFSLFALFRLGGRPTNGDEVARDALLPSIWARVRPFAAKNYLAQILMQTYSPHALRLVVTSLVGLLETARLGFAMSLSDIVQRYLPATLLMRMIRPVFVSRYAENRDFHQLNAFANIVLKLNVFLLAPLLALVAVCGSPLSDLLSGGKYSDSQWVLFCVLLLLLPLSNQLVCSILANTLEENDIQIKAAVFGLIGLFCSFLLVPEFGVYGALVSSALSAVVYNYAAVHMLRRRGYNYRIDALGIMKLFSAAAVGGVVAFLAVWPLSGFVAIASGSIVVMVSFALVAWRIRAFTVNERAMLNSLLPKPVFVF